MRGKTLTGSKFSGHLHLKYSKLLQFTYITKYIAFIPTPII